MPNFRLITRILAIGLAVMILAWIFRTKSQENLPVFSKANPPEFSITYTNASAKAVDLVNLLTSSSVVLDGSEHRLQGLKFGGNPYLEAGETWNYDWDLDSYYPISSLQPGKHTVVLKFDGKPLSPVTFIWKGSSWLSPFQSADPKSPK
jgi:hypothetical protein